MQNIIKYDKIFLQVGGNMNEEFMVLSNSKLIVTDENGCIYEKDNMDVDVKDLLLSENKIEIVDNKLKILYKQLLEQGCVIFLTKNMLKIPPFAIVGGTLIGFLFGGLFSQGNFLAYGVHHAVSAFVYTSLISILDIVYFGSVKLVYDKKIKKVETEISILNELKEKYQSELLELRKKYSNIVIDSKRVENSVSLKEENKVLENYINNEINNIYCEKVDIKNKKLVLSKKK